MSNYHCGYGVYSRMVSRKEIEMEVYLTDDQYCLLQHCLEWESTEIEETTLDNGTQLSQTEARSAVNDLRGAFAEAWQKRQQELEPVIQSALEAKRRLAERNENDG